MLQKKFPILYVEQLALERASNHRNQAKADAESQHRLHICQSLLSHPNHAKTGNIISNGDEDDDNNSFWYLQYYEITFTTNN